MREFAVVRTWIVSARLTNFGAIAVDKAAIVDRCNSDTAACNRRRALTRELEGPLEKARITLRKTILVVSVRTERTIIVEDRHQHLQRRSSDVHRRLRTRMSQTTITIDFHAEYPRAHFRWHVFVLVPIVFCRRCVLRLVGEHNETQNKERDLQGLARQGRRGSSSAGTP